MAECIPTLQFDLNILNPSIYQIRSFLCQKTYTCFYETVTLEKKIQCNKHYGIWHSAIILYSIYVSCIVVAGMDIWQPYIQINILDLRLIKLTESFF